MAHRVEDRELRGPEIQGVVECVTSDLIGRLNQLVTTKNRATDEIHRTRAVQPMTLAAQLQWQLLPPLTAYCPEAVVAGQRDKISEPPDPGSRGSDFARR